jgi:hypothetical protein
VGVSEDSIPILVGNIYANDVEIVKQVDDDGKLIENVVLIS